MMTQKLFITNLLSKNPDATIIGSLGTISYDLATIEHKDKFCVAGAMGAVMSVGLGYALSKPESKVIVLIGDGAFLMKMGSIATILKHKPNNLEVYIINNRQHRSTGGQETNFESIKHLVPFNVVDIDEIPNTL